MLKDQVSLEAMAISAKTTKGQGKTALNRFSSVKVTLVDSKFPRLRFLAMFGSDF